MGDHQKDVSDEIGGGAAADESSPLLEKVRAAMEIESKLTATMERVEPWLSASVLHAPDHINNFPDRPRVRPIPTNVEEAERVLAVARVLAARTSAPAGWNPMAPVVGFSTPSPLPHQLRGGALAALQLERARKAERNRRKRQRLVEERERREEEEEQQASKMEVDHEGPERGGNAGEDEEPATRDPKRREIVAHDKELERSKADLARADAAQQQQQRNLQQLQQQGPQQDVSMNLSDSSDEESD